MIITVKQLRQNNQVFAPQTVAEAVLVKTDTQVITLDKMLNRKLENIQITDNSGLNVKKQGVNVTIEQSNQIQGTDVISPKQFSVDNNGHIKKIIPVNPLEIDINSYTVSYDGSQKSSLQFGDDFIKNDDIITLNWNNL